MLKDYFDSAFFETTLTTMLQLLITHIKEDPHLIPFFCSGTGRYRSTVHATCLFSLYKAGQFDAFEKSLDVELVKAIIGKLETRQVALTMPKFEYESSFGLKQALSTLGMGVAFTPDADFSGMNGERDLLIQDVLHKAFVSVDEAGTEAAAATAVIVGVTSIPAQPVEVKIDRPFIFLIRDIPTGSIIFVGRVLDPAAK
jgi:serpin B